jgi:hypothetical protein
VEPPELWTRYLAPEYRTLGKYALWREKGKWRSYLQVNGQMFRDTMNSNIPRHAIGNPGLSWKQIGKRFVPIRKNFGRKAMMLGFDAEERMIERLPQNFAAKIVWGSRYPHHDTTSDAIDKLARANIDDAMLARMLGGNTAEQFGVDLVRRVGV